MEKTLSEIDSRITEAGPFVKEFLSKQIQRDSQIVSQLAEIGKRFDDLVLAISNLTIKPKADEDCSGEGIGTGTRDRSSNSPQQYPRLPELNPPSFDGNGHPIIWIRKFERFMEFYLIPDKKKVLFAALFLEGQADLWFQGFEEGGRFISWEEFKRDLCERFERLSQVEVIGEFNKLEQIGTVDEYRIKFEGLKALITIERYGFSEEFFIAKFVGGLKEEIRYTVQMLAPTSIGQAMKLARLQEAAIAARVRW